MQIKINIYEMPAVLSFNVRLMSFSIYYKSIRKIDKKKKHALNTPFKNYM